MLPMFSGVGENYPYVRFDVCQIFGSSEAAAA
jgi:hypothetical protein